MSAAGIIEAYQALLLGAELTARDIEERCGVSRPTSYKLFRELAQLDGVVEAEVYRQVGGRKRQRAERALHMPDHVVSDTAWAAGREAGVALALSRQMLRPFRRTRWGRAFGELLEEAEETSPALTNLAGRWHRKLYVHQPGGLELDDEIASVVDVIIQGIEEQRHLSFDHHTLTRLEPRAWRTQPWTLAFDGEELKAIAHIPSKDYGYPLYFNVTQIHAPELDDERWEYPADYDPAKLNADNLSLFRSREEPIELRIRFNSKWAQAFKRRRRWHPSQRIESEGEDGSVVVAWTLQWTPDVMRRVLSFGSDAEVLLPMHIRSELAQKARSLAETYGRPSS